MVPRTHRSLLFIIILATILNLPLAIYAFNKPTSLTIGEGFSEPIGFHDATPRFSWQLPKGTLSQSAYSIEVQERDTDTVLWTSGWIKSDQSVLTPYKGTPLNARQQVEWRVRFKDQDGKESPWSDRMHFELGLLNNKDWQAHWIRPEADVALEGEQVSQLRKEFKLEQDVKHARLYVTAHGVYEIHLNGQKIGNHALMPGWTPYNERLDTITYDVTENLNQGENAIGAFLGTGWYAGRLVWKDAKAHYGQNPEFLLQLEVTHGDGSTTTILSDNQWKSTFDGPIRSSSIYDGETYDAQKEMSGWSTPHFDDSAWTAVTATESLGNATLAPKPLTPMVVTEVLETKKITQPEPGRHVFDLGQNMVGWPKLKIPVEKGKTITIRFAEMLNQDGTLYTENYRSAKSIDFYTPATTGVIEWQPLFTFHGFRYVELSGLAEDVIPDKDWVQGLVLHTDLKRIGSFHSSHEKLNQLQSNITWGQRGNFIDIPTDCPQRDERLGWTGDAQAFGPTSMFNYDSHAFWKSWLSAMRLEQKNSGKIPSVIPTVFVGPDSPGWMDAATIIPWDAYVRTGDREFLSDNYEMMEKLVAFYRTKAKDGVIEEITGFGDWLQPHAENKRGDTPLAYLGTAFYAQSTEIVLKSSKVLGRTEDTAIYQTELDHIKSNFTAKYFDQNGKLKNTPETQTAYLLAIAFDLIPIDAQKQAAAHLVKLIESTDGHLRTGFLGTPHLARILDQMGHGDLAYSLLFKESYPSWFYSINQGATTMWERWNSYSHKDGFGDAGMNSFNHYAYGAIGQWMYERVAGLSPDPEEPGYKHFYIRPLPGGPLTHANAELETPYGKATSSWKLKGKKVIVECQIPPNTTATVISPKDGSTQTVPPGKHRFEF